GASGWERMCPQGPAGGSPPVLLLRNCIPCLRSELPANHHWSSADHNASTCFSVSHCVFHRWIDARSGDRERKRDYGSRSPLLEDDGAVIISCRIVRQDRFRIPPRERHILRHRRNILCEYGAEDLRTHALPFRHRRAQLRARPAVPQSGGRDSCGEPRLERKITAVVAQPRGLQEPPCGARACVYDLPQITRIVFPLPLEHTDYSPQ